MLDSTPEFAARTAAIRRFTRFYTRLIGVLRKGVSSSPFSLAELRVLDEIANNEGPTAAGISRNLGLDPGYLSRMLGRFEQRGLIVRTLSGADARQSHLALTKSGLATFQPLDERAQRELGALLTGLAPRDQARLVSAMETIESLLSPTRTERAPFVLRPHRAGDMGFVVGAHGAVYAEEYGWDAAAFEALCAEIVAGFLKSYDPKREGCWIAEIDGEPVGSAFVVAKSPEVAQLRLVLVLPHVRGMGIGARLLEESLRFARQAGYRAMSLWTQSMLTGARRLYERAGFVRVAETPHHSFGHHLVGETWEREL